MLVQPKHLGGLDLKLSLHLLVGLADLPQPLKLLVLPLLVTENVLTSDAEFLFRFSATAVAVHK